MTAVEYIQSLERKVEALEETRNSQERAGKLQEDDPTRSGRTWHSPNHSTVEDPNQTEESDEHSSTTSETTESVEPIPQRRKPVPRWNLGPTKLVHEWTARRR